MDFERAREVILAVAARRGERAGRAIELHAKVMTSLACIKMHFEGAGDTTRAALTNSVMDLVVKMSVMLDVTPEESNAVAKAVVGDIEEAKGSS